MPYPVYNPYLSNQYVQGLVPQLMPQPTVPLPQLQQPVSGITKVNGRDSALQYQLPPNSMSQPLFDNNGKTFYIVSTDGAGTKTVESFDYFPHVDEQPVRIDGAQFVSRQEFDEFAAKVNAVIGANDGVHGSVQPATTAVGEQAL